MAFVREIGKNEHQRIIQAYGQDTGFRTESNQIDISKRASSN